MSEVHDTIARSRICSMIWIIAYMCVCIYIYRERERERESERERERYSRLLV